MNIKSLWVKFVTLSAAALLYSHPANAQDAQMEAALANLQNSLPGELLNNPFTTQWSTEGNRVRGKIVQSDGAPGGSAFEVSVRKRFPEVWEAKATTLIDKNISKGDVIEVAVWARAEKPLNSLGTGNFDLQIVRNSEPYDTVFSENLRPTSEWQLLTARGVAGADFDADESILGMNIGYGKQTLQFSTIYIIRLSSAQ